MNEYPFSHDEKTGQSAPSATTNQATQPQKNANMSQNSIFSSYSPAVEPPSKKIRYEAIDTALAWLSVLAGILFARALPVAGRPLGTFFALLLLLSLAVFYLLRDKKRLPFAVWCIGAYAALLSTGLLTGGNNTVRRWLVLIVLLSLAVLSCLSRGLSGKGRWSESHLFFTLSAVISTPVTSFPHLFTAISARHESKGRGVWRAIGWGALGLLAAALPSVIIVSVLSYDAQFTALLDRILSFRIDGLGEWIEDILLGSFFAILLFGTLFGGKLRESRKKEDAPDKKAPDLRVFPRALICAFVTPILVIYAIFFVSQWSYYLSAFTHTLPEGLTFAEYARDGFFQLCGVSAFNAIMLLHVHLLMRAKKGKRDPLRTVYTILISLCTLVLIATALSKMLLYIDSYGLTQKRVYASWFMILLAVIFLLTLLAQVIKRLRLSLAIPIACALLFAVIAIPNIEGTIANYNVDAYLDGRLPTVDVYTIELYGTSSVPALIRLEEELSDRDDLSPNEQGTLRAASSVLDRWAAVFAEIDSAPLSFNLPTHRARTLLQDRSQPDCAR